MSQKVAKSKKIIGIIGICIASVLIIIAFCGRYFTSGFKSFANFFLGAFGMSFYGIMAAIIVACSFMLAGKSVKIPAKYIVFFAMLFVSIVLCVHILTTTYLPRNFSDHMRFVYNYYDDTFGVPTFGGVVFGIIAYALQAALTIYGAMILIVGLMVWSIIVVGEFFYSYFTGKLALTQKTAKNADIEPSQTTSDFSFQTSEVSSGPTAQDILFGQDIIYPEEVAKEDTSDFKYNVSPQSVFDKTSPEKSEAERILFGRDNSPRSEVRKPFFEEKTSKREEERRETAKNEKDDILIRGFYAPENKSAGKDEAPSGDWKVSEDVVVPSESNEERQPFSEPLREEIPKEVKSYSETTAKNETVTPKVEKRDEVIDFSDIVTDEPVPDIEDYGAEDGIEEESGFSADSSEDNAYDENADNYSYDDDDDKDAIVAIPKETPFGKDGMQQGFDFVSRGELEKVQSKMHVYMEYSKPPLDLLDDATIVDDFESNDRKRAADAIVNKLSIFGIKVENVDIIVGPSVTRYTFRVLSQKTRMGDFKQYSDDIKACIEAQDDIRIEAPLHGTNLVGIEVANKIKTPVVLRSLLDSEAFEKGKGKLVFAIGREITGKVIVADLAEMPHLLIAGTTGSGKSVCLNCLIVSLMYKYGPEYVRFVMVDPKFVELSRYNGIPHMLTTETITTVQDALAGMDYLISEMESRYQLFRTSHVGNITEYNARVNTKLAQKLPYLVFVVDELADLMSVSKKNFESKLMRLAQKSRAAGIHIVLATQRPDTSVITGTIKANLPCRMALKVASQYDSQTILGGGGAEKLLGKGDMLFLNAGSNEPERVQGAYISNDEIRSLVEYTRSTNEIYYDESISEEIFVSRKKEEEPEEREESSANKETKLDPYCKKALRFWLERNNGRASIASIQRSLNIGFNRAGRIMEQLQKLKYVEELSPSDPNSKPLKVLVTIEELDELFPDMDD